MKHHVSKAQKNIRKKNPASFLFSGVAFVIAELLYAIYSHSQSTLMDALYDAAELIFIILYSCF